MTTSRPLPLVRLGAVLAVATLALTGCTASAETPAPSASTTPAADTITVEDAWIKSADDGMTPGFGVLINDGDTDATLVAATTTAAGIAEVHETTADDSGAMVMRKVDGGVDVPAGGELRLEPGGHHLMLMDLAGPLTAGSEITLLLEFSDGSTVEVTAPVKDFGGANENYDDGMEQ